MKDLIVKTDLCEKGINAMGISRLIKKGALGNLGYGFYIESPNILHFDNDEIMIKINSLLDNFPFVPNRMIFSSISLNFCINQLISNTTYVVEVEKEYIQSVFEILKENLYSVVLLKPDKESRINYWVPNVIYVTELFKRSPVNKDGTITIEKLIMDLLFDENIYSLYSSQDIDLAIDILCSKYVINYKTLFSYAARRNRKNQLLNRINKYIPKEILKVVSYD